jgi:cell division protein ZapA
MAEASIMVGGRSYAMHCRDGEEAHLARLAAMVEEKASAARRATPGLTEVRQLLFAAILLADELHDEKMRAGARQESLDLRPQPEPGQEEVIAARINALAARIEGLAQTLDA